MRVGSNKQFILLSLYLSVLIILFTLFYSSIIGTSENQVRFLIAYSAKISVLLFIITSTSSGIHRTIQSEITKQLLSLRPYLGLAFGIFHLTHLCFLFWLQKEIHPVFTLAKSASLFAGSIAYLLMVLMMITTFPAIRSKLNPLIWKYLHTIGLYWILGIFISTYSKRVFNHNENHTIFVILILILILRIYFQIKDRGIKLENSTY